MSSVSSAQAPDWVDEGLRERERMELLASEITELAANLWAAEARWLSLIAEFDRSGGWGEWGCRSCAHWLSWRCGVALPAARERVRVARRLEELPRVAAAFAEGVLSYSKVRAITRVAEPATEEDLLELAKAGTAAHLEKIVRTWRRVSGSVDREGVDPAARRGVRWRYEDDGETIVIVTRAPVDQVALLLRALQQAVADMAAVPQASQGAGDASAPPADAGAPPGEGSTPPGALHDAAMAQPTDVSAETSRGAPRRLIPAEADPRVAGADDPIAARRADALVLIAESFLAHGPAVRPPADRHQTSVHVDADALPDENEVPDRPGEPARRRSDRGGRSSQVAGGANALRCDLDGRGIPSAVARMLSCDASIVTVLHGRDGTPMDVGRRTRTISPALRRALDARDGGCRFPGCWERRFVDGHHIIFWADGGETTLANLVLLCRFHHRQIHTRGFTVTAVAPGEFAFTRPDGEPIPDVPTAAIGDPSAIKARNRIAGLAIGADTCVPSWYGEDLDLGYTIDLLFGHREQFRRSSSPEAGVAA